MVEVLPALVWLARPCTDVVGSEDGGSVWKMAATLRAALSSSYLQGLRTLSPRVLLGES